LHGNYNLNPFNLAHYDLRSAGFFVNGQSIPNQILETNFQNHEITSAYNAFLETANLLDPSSECDVSLKNFGDGFTILGFNIDTSDQGGSMEFWSKAKQAHTKLELRFADPLNETINVILMAEINQLLTIDASRNVANSQ
jgi:hypothetical protein